MKGIGATSGQAEVLVISPGKENEDVRCFSKPGDEPWAILSKGQEITVRGAIRKDQGNPMMVNCTFAATGPNLGVTTTAEEMVKVHTASEENAAKMYGGKSVVITGEIVRVEDELISRRVVHLKGPGDKTLPCSVYVGKRVKDAKSKLVPGATIKIYGELKKFSFGLENCELISQ